MSLFDPSRSAKARRLVMIDAIIAALILGITALLSVGIAIASLLTVMMSDACGTGSGGEPLICSDHGGGLWLGAEAFLCLGLLAVFIAGAWWTWRRAGTKLAGVAAFATFGGSLLVVLGWLGLLLLIGS